MDKKKIMQELDALIESDNIHDLPLESVNFKNALKFADRVGSKTGGFILDNIEDDEIEALIDVSVSYARNKSLNRAILTQEIINASNGVSLRAVTPKSNRAGVVATFVLEQIKNRNLNEPISEILRGIIVSKISTMAMATVDDLLYTNMQALNNAGINQYVTRKLSPSHNFNNPHDPKHTDWCEDLAGTYRIDEVPENFWRRHDNCKCTIDYKGDKGENNWSKANGMRKTIGSGKGLQRMEITYKHSDGTTTTRRLNAKTGKYETVK